MMPKIHVLWVPEADPQRDDIVRTLNDETPGGVCLHMDRERKGLMQNWLGALDCAAKDETPWSVILSDDAYPLPGWQGHLEEATQWSPQPVLGLTYFGGYGSDALQRGAPYGVGQYLIWGGAIAYHHTIIQPLAHWARAVWERTGYPHDDCLTAAWLLRHGKLCALTSRAIFDQPVKASLLNHNTPIRRPSATIKNTIGPAYSALPRSVRVAKQVWPEIRELAKESA